VPDFSFQSLIRDLAQQPQQQTMWDGLNNAGQKLAQILPAAPQPHNIEDGPEYNKWDEALRHYGTIRLPKERDNPQEWLNQEHFQNILKDVDRRDLPDGSVILSRRAFTS